MENKHHFSILSLRRRLGATLAWAGAHDEDAAKYREDAELAAQSACKARNEAEGLKETILFLGGEPTPTELDRGG